MALRDTCKFGAFYDGGTFTGPNARIQRIQAWEARYGIRMDIINDFRKVGYWPIAGASGNIQNAMTTMQSTGIQGRRHCMTWEWATGLNPPYPAVSGDTKYTYPFRPYDIVYTTQHDQHITDFGTALAQWGAEVYIRLFHEMNANWYGWALDPSCMKDAWQKIVDIFRNVGATNVKWFWCSNGGDVPSQWNKQESYYPGDSYVDVVGFDQYNAYTGWRDFSELIQIPYDRMRAMAPSKKIWIGETGCPEGNASIPLWVNKGQPTRSQWYTDMFNSVGFDEIEYILMFDTQGGFNWRIDTTTASRDTFASLVSSCALVSPPPPTGASSGLTTDTTGAYS